MYLNRFFLALSALLIFTTSGHAQRRSYSPPSRIATFSAEATTTPLRDEPDLKLMLNSDGTAILTVKQKLAIGVAEIEKEYIGRFHTRSLQAIFTDSDDFSSLRLGLKRAGRSGLAIFSFDKYTAGENSINIERYRFDAYGKATIATRYNASSYTDSTNKTTSYERHTYQSAKYSSKRLASQTTRTDMSYASNAGIDRSSLTHTYYLYDELERASGTIYTSYGRSELSPDPIATLSYSHKNNSNFSFIGASTSESGKNAARFFRYVNYLASMKVPANLNFLMDHARAAYFENKDQLDFGYTPKLTVEYRVEASGRDAKLIPLGGRIGSGSVYIAKGEVDALQPEGVAHDDIVIHWPYPFYYSSKLQQAGSSARNIALLYHPEESDFGFIILGDKNYTFVSASDFADGNGSASTELEGEKIHFTLGTDKTLQFVVE